ncbi:MAG: tRNA (adenosine(37)-N6)-dimethylallyltransferase MiaA [Gammaproteobacteria bacterium]|nr:tRNA (adenosine(37)-N6)-dimethylallyltransferase MiaA [Gammaproteobacteria bacterium]
MKELPSALLLMGPTASGKTALALSLVDQFPFEIISVDSALVYRGMDVGTSKPSHTLLEKYPHHLVNIREPSEVYSAAEFRNDALRIMADIVSRNKIPLLVGGTMLYFRALVNGLSDLPAADADVRRALEKEMEALGSVALHKKLEFIDPVAAKKIHPNDPQRIQRALEVYQISGMPISEWWEKGKQQKLPYTVLKLAITASDRAILHDRIAARFSEMLDEGFVGEVESLRARGDLDLDKPSMRSVGYRQVWQYLDGECGYDEMKFKGVVATRQLAKRQLTWLRSEQELNWLNSDEKEFNKNALKLVSQIPRID